MISYPKIFYAADWFLCGALEFEFVILIVASIKMVKRVACIVGESNQMHLHYLIDTLYKHG
jgi:hypothetical protein